MSARSEKPKNRRVKLVGGGYKWTRGGDKSTGGSVKAQRRKLRQTLKSRKRDMSVEERKAIKAQIAQLLAQKDGR